MTTYIALLRAINVGGNRTIRMVDLRSLFEEAGGQGVTTYIQSGNLVFAHPSRSPAKLESELESRIEAATGFDVPVILRTAAELSDVLRANPFVHADLTKVHVAFLRQAPSPATVDPSAFAPEEFEVVGREVYLHLPNGMGRARLPQALSLLRSPATVRNWRTVTKLLELATA